MASQRTLAIAYCQFPIKGFGLRVSLSAVLPSGFLRLTVFVCTRTIFLLGIIQIHHFPNLQATSSDNDFVFGGRCIAEGDQDSESSGIDFAAPIARAAAPAACEDNDSEDDIVFVALAHSHGPLPQRRRRAPLQTSGSFWVLVVESGRVSGVAPTTVLGVVELHLELSGMDHDAQACGILVYTVRRTVVFNEDVTLLADVDVATLGGWLRALEIVGPCILQTSDVTTLTAFLAGENAKLELDVLACSDTEAQTLKQVAESSTPRRFRDVRIYKRWADPSRIIARIPNPSVLRKWRREREQGERNRDSDDSGLEPAALVGSAGHVGPNHHLLYLPPKFVEQSSRRTLGFSHALGFARHWRSPKHFVQALDDANDYLFQVCWSGDHEEPTERRHDSDPCHTSLRQVFARRCCVLECDASLVQTMAPRWSCEGNQCLLRCFVSHWRGVAGNGNRRHVR